MGMGSNICRKSLLEQTTKEKNTDKNNSELVDTGENQGMSWGEIEALKREAKASARSRTPRFC